MNQKRTINTFSIVAYDAAENACGVAVASKFLAVGSLVPWAQAGVGAVATQALAKVSFGPNGLARLASGKAAEKTLKELLAGDPKREDRQLGIVDAQGGAAAFTGANCHPWAGHHVGEGFACLGNLLAGEEVVQAMADAYTSAKGELADRLVAALKAGDDAGGDKRGRQSAAVMVVRPYGGYGGDTDRYLDLRVDDHTDPVTQLMNLVASHHLFFGTPNPKDQTKINGDIARELQGMMINHGYMQGEASGKWDAESKSAFWQLIGNENLEERWHIDRTPDSIDSVALDYLRQRFG